MAILKSRFATQKVNAKLQHTWELGHVRTRFAEFKHRVPLLGDADDQELQRLPEAVEVASKDLIHTVEPLLAALS